MNGCLKIISTKYKWLQEIGYGWSNLIKGSQNKIRSAPIHLISLFRADIKKLQHPEERNGQINGNNSSTFST